MALNILRRGWRSGRHLSRLRFLTSEVKGLSHVDADSNLPKMVDVGGKDITKREAHARSVILLPSVIADYFKQGKEGSLSKKGPVLSTAIIAGTMAVKNTSQLIPFCHPLPIEKCDIHTTFDSESDSIIVDCIVSATHKTGVEMEALTGASMTSLCIYDMCKALSHDMVITETRLISKSGGKSDFLDHNEKLLKDISDHYAKQTQADRESS